MGVGDSTYPQNSRQQRVFNFPRDARLA